MNETKPSTDDVLRRLSEVLDVLNKISDDLQDIAKSLKAVSPKPPSTTPQAEPAMPISSPTSSTPTSPSVGKGVEDIRMMFTQELEGLLLFEDKDGFIKITPRQYLGSDNFAKIASVIRSAGGEYVSAGRGSHFKVPK